MFLFAVDLFLMFTTVRDMGGYQQVIDSLFPFLLQLLLKLSVKTYQKSNKHGERMKVKRLLPLQVTAQQLWKQVYNALGGNPSSTSAATCTRRHYER